MNKIDKIKMLLQFTNAGSQIERTFRERVNSMPLPGDEGQQETVKEAILGRFNKHYDEYITAQVDIYNEQLSEDAVDASIAFYTSSSGDEILNKMPIIQRQITAIGSELGVAIFQDMMNIIDEYDLDDLEDDDPS